MALNRSSNLTAHDDWFARLVALHEGLSDEEARRVDARLILLLLNHIGDPEVIAEALAAARKPPAG